MEDVQITIPKKSLRSSRSIRARSRRLSVKVLRQKLVKRLYADLRHLRKRRKKIESRRAKS